MKSCCLVTGGAGFIGCASAPLLLERYKHVVALDILHPQVHRQRHRPVRLPPDVDLVVADVTEESSWERFLDNYTPSVILHLAAETGTAQSLQEASRHAKVNVVGLTSLLDALSKRGQKPEQIVLTSSRAVYGEGAWQSQESSKTFYPGQRDSTMLTQGKWDFEAAMALPSEAGVTQPNPISVYGVTKLTQEQILRCWGKALDVPVSILRLQNVYGPGQSLTNSYTGIVSLFAQIARKGNPIPLYEDGQMRRDFVFIDDVARAIVQALEVPPRSERTVDIGSGESTTLSALASLIAKVYRAPDPYVTGEYRKGDVRHASCSGDKAKIELKYQPRFKLEEGIRNLCSWIDEVLN